MDLNPLIRHPPKSGTVLTPSTELQEFIAWGLREGIQFPKLNYPVRYDPGYIGSQALEEIGPNEAIVTVPKRLLFMASLADESELTGIITEHPELFEAEQNSWYDDYRLIAFMLFEKRKGRASFWYYFLAALPRDADSVMQWSDSELEELQDPLLVQDAKERLKDIHLCWEQLRETLLDYPQFFTPDMLTFEEFQWAQQIVASRGFGKSVPSTSLCPIAEFLNHSTVQTYYIYGPASANQPKVVSEDDGDDLPFDADGTWPVSYDMLGLIAKMTQYLSEAEYTRLAEIARHLDNLRYERMQAAAWKPMEFQVTDQFIFRLMTGPKEIYSKGAEIYLCYGADSNRHLLIYYGFTLHSNKYNYAYVFAPMKNFLHNEEQLKFARDAGIHEKWCFKVREREICLQLIRTMRALHWTKGIHSIDACYYPKSWSLEKIAFESSIQVLEAALSDYPTTMEEDERLLTQHHESMREVFAIDYRRQRKLAIHTQIQLLSALKDVAEAILAGSSFPVALSSLETRTYPNLNLPYKVMLAPYLSEVTNH